MIKRSIVVDLEDVVMVVTMAKCLASQGPDIVNALGLAAIERLDLAAKEQWAKNDLGTKEQVKGSVDGRD